MINSDLIRGHLETVILKLIIEQDRYGYEIAKNIKERTNNEFQIKEATLYSIVKRLEDKDLIESYKGKLTHGKTRRYYRVTTLGKVYYKEKISEWIELKEVLESLLEVSS